MNQPRSPIHERTGYLLKRTDVLLRSTMDDAFAPLGLSAPQYACLELLDEQPGMSNSELARGAFVTRQSMHLVLRGLVDRGLVTRPKKAKEGRQLPASLTATGQALLLDARERMSHIESALVSCLDEAGRRQLDAALLACVEGLTTYHPYPEDSR